MKMKPQTKRELRDALKFVRLTSAAACSAAGANVALALPEDRRNSFLAVFLCLATGIACYCLIWCGSVAIDAYMRRRAERKAASAEPESTTPRTRVIVRDGRWLGDPNE